MTAKAQLKINTLTAFTQAHKIQATEAQVEQRYGCWDGRSVSAACTFRACWQQVLWAAGEWVYIVLVGMIKIKFCVKMQLSNVYPTGL